MLVLSRKYGQKTFLTTASGERIDVTVCEIRGDKVRLGFSADKSVKILRDEVQDEINAAQAAAAAPK